jgi:hypothetical protein
VCKYSDKSRSLPPVERLVIFRIVPHQHLHEGRLECLDRLDIPLAVFELEFGLAALLGGHARNGALAASIAQDGGAELRIDQYAGMLLRHRRCGCLPECVVNNPFRFGDFLRLALAQPSGPAKQSSRERTAMIEWQDVKRLVVSYRHGSSSRMLVIW